MEKIKNNIFILLIFIICSCSIGISFGVSTQLTKEFVNKYKHKKNGEKESNYTMAKAIEKVKPSIVNIIIADDLLNKETNNINKNINKAGTGIIFEEDENNVYIVTNEHVVKDAKYIKISFLDDKYIEGSIIACDEAFDLAILYVPKKLFNNIENMKIGKFCSKENIKEGDFVLTLGNVLGQGYTSTFGIISAINRKISVGENIIEVIQTDAPINPGSSGSPLVNLKGEIIGINTLKISKSNIEGVGYTISTDIFLPRIKYLKNKMQN